MKRKLFTMLRIAVFFLGPHTATAQSVSEFIPSSDPETCKAAWWEAVLEPNVAIGAMTETRKNTIVNLGNRLAEGAQKSGFTLTKCSSSIHDDIVEVTIDFIKVLSDRMAVAGSFSSDNEGGKTTVTITHSTLTPPQRKEILDLLSKVNVIDNEQVNTILKHWNTLVVE